MQFRPGTFAAGSRGTSPLTTVGAASCRDAVSIGGLRGWKPLRKARSSGSGILSRCSVDRRPSRLEAAPTGKARSSGSGIPAANKLTRAFRGWKPHTVHASGLGLRLRGPRDIRPEAGVPPEAEAERSRNGVPSRIRTCDPSLRRRMLYPTELPGRRSAITIKDKQDGGAEVHCLPVLSCLNKSKKSIEKQ